MMAKKEEKENYNLMDYMPQNLAGGWRDVFSEILEEKKYRNKFRKLCECHLDKIKNNDNDIGEVSPEYNKIFSCFTFKDYKDIKCVILGHDPYPYSGYADGLCFSISDLNKFNEAKDNRMGESLKVILDERKEDERPLNSGVRDATTGDLSEWARKGVLLLNRALTVKVWNEKQKEKEEKKNEKGKKTESHSNKFEKFWWPFTERVVEKIAYGNKEADDNKECVFIFLGSSWKKLARKFLNDEKIKAIWCIHPSVWSNKEQAKADERKKNGESPIPFKGSRIFTETLRLLEKNITKKNLDDLFPMP